MTKLDLTRRSLMGVLAGGAAMPAAARAQSGEAARFTHGVASGDPQADRVILWTRAVPEKGGAAIIRWAVARDAGMANIVANGEAQAQPGRDYCVKVDASGLAPGETYFYQFRAGDTASPVARTRTLPKADVTETRFAAVSCSNFPAGYFNVYRLLAGRDDLQAIVHLGDYIYEYGPGGYATEWGAENGRIPEPPREAVTLSDYRLRYAQYRADPDLQAAHAAHPFICVWDDHETANDTWSGGAENHNEGEGAWSARRRASVQAYMEWLPIREPEAGRAREAIWRSFDFGKAATLTMLETRLAVRDEPLDYNKTLTYPELIFDTSGAQPRLVDTAGGRASVERLPALSERTRDGWQAITDYQKLKRLSARRKLPRNVKPRPDVASFMEKVNAPDREIIGPAQLDFVAGEMERSRRAGIAWQALGNQVIMAKVRGPRYGDDLPWWYKLMMNRGQGAETNMAFLERSYWDLPMNMDSWDGYGAEREQLYDAARDSGANLATMTGDSHAFWANDLVDARGETRGAEFGVTSVSSPGMYSDYAAPTVDFNKMVMDAAKDVKHMNWQDRGCIIMTFAPDRVTGDYVRVSTIESRDFSEETYVRYAARPGEGIAEI